MKWLRPELKFPKLTKSDVKVPRFLADLYWDLWDRRLIPFVALVIVAIVAVPFLLGGGSKEAPPPAATPGTVAALAGEGAPPTLTVVQAEPGLRDYRKRFGRRSPTDPFKPHFVAPPPTSGGAQTNTSTSFTATTTTTATQTASSAPTNSATTNPATSTPEPAPTSPSSGGGETGGSAGGAPSNSGGGEAKLPVAFFSFAIDVKITRVEPEGSDSKKAPEPSVKHGVLPLTALPGEKAPVVTYMGLSKKGKPLLLVSTDVHSVFGETKCLEGDEVCQLIEVEPGFPVTFVFGANEVRYRINVLKVEPVVTGHN
ncbi:MAG: hypothetical protein WBM00_02740 [Solirubrobacterales bacterium]